MSHVTKLPGTLDWVSNIFIRILHNSDENELFLKNIHFGEIDYILDLVKEQIKLLSNRKRIFFKTP